MRVKSKNGLEIEREVEEKNGRCIKCRSSLDILYSSSLVVIEKCDCSIWVGEHYSEFSELKSVNNKYTRELLKLEKRRYDIFQKLY